MSPDDVIDLGLSLKTLRDWATEHGSQHLRKLVAGKFAWLDAAKHEATTSRFATLTPDMADAIPPNGYAAFGCPSEPNNPSNAEVDAYAAVLANLTGGESARVVGRTYTTKEKDKEPVVRRNELLVTVLAPGDIPHERAFLFPAPVVNLSFSVSTPKEEPRG